MPFRETVPERLRAMPRWVCYRLEAGAKPGRRAKVPYCPKSGLRAKSNDPSTWATWSDARAALEVGPYDGLGFQLGDGVFGVDLDGVISDGTLNALAQDIVSTLDSYTEFSPSGTGVHILCLGRIPEGERRRGCVEMYGEGRFFTVTGRVFGTQSDLMERSRQAAIVHAKYLHRAEEPPRVVPMRRTDESDDASLISRACASRKGARFSALWNGDTRAYGGDHSRADLALINDLAFWTKGDPVRMDALFRQSGLMRSKWDKRHGRLSYGALTIEKALAHYAPAQPLSMAVSGASNAFLTASVAVPLNAAAPPPQRHPSAETSSTAGSKTAAVPMEPSVTPQDAFGHGSQANYLANAFRSDMARMRASQAYATGFTQLDKLCGGMQAGLYLLGAGSSLGKTTFALQLCDQVAAQGGHALYFSLEQSRFELASKSLSRTLAQTKPGAARTAFELRSSSDSQPLEDAIRAYAPTAERVHVVEGDASASSITATIDRFLSLHPGVKPLVVVDYLQIIAAEEPRQSDKERVDAAVRALKKAQMAHGIPLLLISSLNRANYLNPIDFESFKESGGIEYTADVVWGLQVRAVRDCPFASEKNAAERRERVRKAKLETPRNMELVCLKNRFGLSSFTCGFHYDARFDLFEEACTTPQRRY